MYLIIHKYLLLTYYYRWQLKKSMQISPHHFKEKLISWLLTAKTQYNIRKVLIMKTNMQHPW